jgi:CheY-like chemotaxis protein
MRFANGTIALIQNNGEDILLLKDAFRKQCPSWHLEVLTDAEECVAYLAGEGKYQDRGRYPVPSAIVSDLDLSGMSGFGVLAWLRERPELVTIPVFVLAASRQPRDIQRAYALGARSYVVKPVGPGELRSLVHAITGHGYSESEPGLRQAKIAAGGREVKTELPGEIRMKRIVVGSSSESPHIRSQKKYRVRIGNKWFEGAFSKRWFGWLFDDFGDTGMQLNLIDEVFELPAGSSALSAFRRPHGRKHPGC